MEPRIAGPPFVRALEELVSASRGNHELLLRLSPVDAVNELMAGRCALAIGWPGAQGAGTAKPAVDASAVACVPLPGSPETFAWEKAKYEQGNVHHVPLLACEGRMASVTSSARHPAAARQFALALASGDWGARVSSASQATAVFRISQLADAERWSPAGGRVATIYAEAVAESLSTHEVVYALRIEGRDEYLAALDGAVRAAVSGQAEPADALRTAADKWKAITQRLGLDAQRRACEASDVRVAF